MADQSIVQQGVDTAHTNANILTETGVTQERANIGQIAQVDEISPETNIWCLNCHRQGHWAQTCDQTQTEIQDEDRWDLLARVRLDPTPIHGCPGLRKLINLLTISEVQNIELIRHINARDGIIATLYDELSDLNSPFCHQVWFRFMSAFNIIVESSATRFRNTLDQIHDHIFKVHMYRDETLPAFLKRVPATALSVIASKEKVQAATDTLEAMGNRFEERFAKFYTQMNLFLKQALGGRKIDFVYRICLRAASRAMIRNQPVLECSDVYVVRWRFPDIDQVFAEEGLTQV